MEDQDYKILRNFLKLQKRLVYDNINFTIKIKVVFNSLIEFTNTLPSTDLHYIQKTLEDIRNKLYTNALCYVLTNNIFTNREKHKTFIKKQLNSGVKQIIITTEINSP